MMKHFVGDLVAYIRKKECIKKEKFWAQYVGPYDCQTTYLGLQVFNLMSVCWSG